ncbi:iron-containing redox enzyme family protein [Burkholderia gladioli]|uniref:iron-containing redox enzyme family protein n=1 Tax=Burkholderia gladioli TaxID=28095 RepID=UPI001D12DD96|nr:iron-containing redox enzyme family protein [Burkholderia gladioli]
MHITRPMLRSDSAIRRLDDCLVITYLDEDYEIEFDDPASLPATEILLGRLDGTRTVDELSQDTAGLRPEQVASTLSILDGNFLLAEGGHAGAPISGLAFALHLEDLYYNRWMGRDGETELVRAVFDGQASRDVLIGWGFECYHVTTRAHDCLAPIIARMHDGLKPLAIDYVLDEYRHDKLLMKSLLALGHTREAIEGSLPLPYTHAVMNLLARWSNTDLLSFMGCLFVFEGTQDIGDAYIRQLEQYDLPPEFLRGQSVHNDVNNAGDHGAVSRLLYSRFPSIGVDDQARVIRNLRMLYDAQRRKHRNVLDYYRAPTIGIPRMLPR